MVAKSGALVAGFLVASGAAVSADTAVQVGGALGLLNKPAGAARGSVVLIPGGDGIMGIKPDGTFGSLGGNQLVRTRKAYANAGLASLTIDRGVDVGAAVKYMEGVAKPVTVVATSRGSLRVAAALRAKPAGLVLTASFLDDVKGAIGSAEKLPATLVVHHRQDGCKKTPPSAVEPFKAWGGAKVTVVWMTGGKDEGDPCQAKGHHGFAGIDGQVVSTVSGFAAGR